MKLNTTLATVLFAAVSSLSVVSYAADADKAPAMKPHSHMEEKTGVPAKDAAAKVADKSEAAKSDKAKAAKYDVTKDKSKHLHPRDGK